MWCLSRELQEMLNSRLHYLQFYYLPLLCLFFIAGKCTNGISQDPITSTEQNAISKNFTLKFTLPKEIKESSGLLYFDQAIWTHNDGGNKPVLYKIDPETGRILKDITINDVENHDWEDIGQDDEFVYISDAGNNAGNRKDLNIIKIAKTSLLDKSKDEEFSILDFTYEDQFIFSKRQYQHNFDCEAITVYNEQLLLFTKNHKDYQSNWYQMDLSGKKQIAKKIKNYNPKGLLTGVDYDPDHNALVFCGYEKNKQLRTFQAFISILMLDEVGGIKSHEKIYLNTDAQTEGICYKGKGKFYISSEKSRGKPGAIYEFDANSFY